MYKIIKRNYNKSKGKVLRTYYSRNCVLNFLDHNIQTMQDSIDDENDFIDIEKNHTIVATIYPINKNIEYFDIKNAIYKVENLKVKECD